MKCTLRYGPYSQRVFQYLYLNNTAYVTEISQMKLKFFIKFLFLEQLYF